MKVIRHAGVASRMVILDDQARQQMTLHFQLSLQCNVSPITGFVRHTAKKKRKVATYILVLWAMIGQDSMHVQHNIRPMRWEKNEWYTMSCTGDQSGVIYCLLL